jgi:predicted RNA binding protein YcfA (HicA-like mRNA interferase family)
MKTSELAKMLKKAGCSLIKHGREHDLWYSPLTGETFPVARHQSQEIATGTVNNIFKAAGLR